MLVKYQYQNSQQHRLLINHTLLINIQLFKEENKKDYILSKQRYKNIKLL